MTKLWYTSKTVWVNLLALIASVSFAAFGYEITAEAQIITLTVINFILRLVTKEEIVWNLKK